MKVGDRVQVWKSNLKSSGQHGTVTEITAIGIVVVQLDDEDRVGYYWPEMLITSTKPKRDAA